MKFEKLKSIKRISIMNSENGIELYNKSFEPSYFLEHDSQLVSGFISALISFSQEIVRDDIQEIVFSNSHLFFRRLSTVIVVLMTTLGIDQQLTYTMIHELGNQLETLLETKIQLDTISPDLIRSFENLVNQSLTQKEVVSFPTLEPIKKPKIVIAGLSKAGKTTAIRCFFYTWNHEEIQSIRPTIDHSIFHSFLDFVRTELILFDLGGQTQYIANHLAIDTKWKDAAAIIFFVDILKLDDFKQAYEYLTKIIEILKVNNEEPFLGIFAHKYDPDKIDELQPNLLKFLKIFRGITDWPRYSIFLSSIYDDSIHLAFMRTLARIIPRDLVQRTLESAIYFETQNQVWQTISNQIDLISADSEQIVKLAIPYGENLANKIFMEWLARDTQISPKLPTKNLFPVEITDIRGGFRIDVTIPKDDNSLMIIKITEGLITGLGNVFGLSKIIRIKMDQKSEMMMVSWVIFES